MDIPVKIAVILLSCDTGVLYKGYWRVDDCLPTVCLLRSTRVCTCQRRHPYRSSYSYADSQAGVTACRPRTLGPDQLPRTYAWGKMTRKRQNIDRLSMTSYLCRTRHWIDVKCQMSKTLFYRPRVRIGGAGGRRNVRPCRVQQRTVQFSDVPWKWWW